MSAIKGFVAIVAIVLTVIITNAFAPTLLGVLSEEAKTSMGSDGEGFSVENETIDRGANIALVQIPSAMVFIVSVWAFMMLLATLAYLGVL
ncbi:hypothetical protein [Halomarina oriensis]|uniref:Uncharacterized protein n=1 Tax=Halomarina oriensis TaxID=671145 RepID=A0A6B0GH99_9EURY|nr:hypothetical protein [Halomarina oriensis]MWG33141.1 hypothetical protein [Halomarina oriensis]